MAYGRHLENNYISEKSSDFDEMTTMFPTLFVYYGFTATLWILYFVLKTVYISFMFRVSHIMCLDSIFCWYY